MRSDEHAINTPCISHSSRTLARETIPVSWESNKVAGASPLQAVTGASRSGDPEAKLDSIINSLRRAVRLKKLAVST